MSQVVKPTFTTSTGKFPNHAYMPNKVSAHWNTGFFIAYRNGVKIFHAHIVNKLDVKLLLQDLAPYCIK